MRERERGMEGEEERKSRERLAATLMTTTTSSRNLAGCMLAGCKKYAWESSIPPEIKGPPFAKNIQSKPHSMLGEGILSYVPDLN